MDARDLEIVRPCPIDLDALGVERGKRVIHCDHCQTDVHDLSTMTRAEATAFVDARRGHGVCVSYLRAKDGTIRFADDEVSTHPSRREPSLVPIARLRAAAAALALAACTPHGDGAAQVIDDAGDEVVVDRNAPVIPNAAPVDPPASAVETTTETPSEPEPTPCVSPKIERRRGGIRPRPRRDPEFDRIDGLLDI
ncbi:MAG: hypothetical protein KC420_14535 [Myxococcales bacterium]|nr:hypothetical protein [Myxococcales bacterium]MCB9569426.1 hypothetical protein [Myxococcales bacterium]MCB9706242.1 hypothetical protein [Myxococcales bacterium]